MATAALVSSTTFASNATFPEILSDLATRFVLNIPDEDLASPQRVLFQIEQAWWFYEDFLRPINPALPAYTLKHFSALFLRHCPLLHHWRDSHEDIFEAFMTYKFRVPVCGVIMLDDKLEQCVLVKGWSNKSGWGFPRGKINEDEDDVDCAAREVLEETGFDASGLLERKEYIEKVVREQRVRLYIVAGVPLDTVFEPQTRKEISKIEWHRLEDLPGYGSKSSVASLGNHHAAAAKDNKFYTIAPFLAYISLEIVICLPMIRLLKEWVKKKKRGKKKEKSAASHQVVAVKETPKRVDSPATSVATSSAVEPTVASSGHDPVQGQAMPFRQDPFSYANSDNGALDISRGYVELKGIPEMEQVGGRPSFSQHRKRGPPPGLDFSGATPSWSAAAPRTSSTGPFFASISETMLPGSFGAAGPIYPIPPISNSSQEGPRGWTFRTDNPRGFAPVYAGEDPELVPLSTASDQDDIRPPTPRSRLLRQMSVMSNSELDAMQAAAEAVEDHLVAAVAARAQGRPLTPTSKLLRQLSMGDVLAPVEEPPVLVDPYFGNRPMEEMTQEEVMNSIDQYFSSRPRFFNDESPNPPCRQLSFNDAKPVPEVGRIFTGLTVDAEKANVMSPTTDENILSPRPLTPRSLFLQQLRGEEPVSVSRESASAILATASKGPAASPLPPPPHSAGSAPSGKAKMGPPPGLSITSIPFAAKVASPVVEKPFASPTTPTTPNTPRGTRFGHKREPSRPVTPIKKVLGKIRNDVNVAHTDTNNKQDTTGSMYNPEAVSSSGLRELKPFFNKDNVVEDVLEDAPKYRKERPKLHDIQVPSANDASVGKSPLSATLQTPGSSHARHSGSSQHSPPSGSFVGSKPSPTAAFVAANMMDKSRAATPPERIPTPREIMGQHLLNTLRPATPRRLAEKELREQLQRSVDATTLSEAAIKAMIEQMASSRPQSRSLLVIAEPSIPADESFEQNEDAMGEFAAIVSRPIIPQPPSSTGTLERVRHWESPGVASPKPTLARNITPAKLEHDVRDPSSGSSPVEPSSDAYGFDVKASLVSTERQLMRSSSSIQDDTPVVHRSHIAASVDQVFGRPELTPLQRPRDSAPSYGPLGIDSPKLGLSMDMTPAMAFEMTGHVAGHQDNAPNAGTTSLLLDIFRSPKQGSEPPPSLTANTQSTIPPTSKLLDLFRSPEAKESRPTGMQALHEGPQRPPYTHPSNQQYGLDPFRNNLSDYHSAPSLPHRHPSYVPHVEVEPQAYVRQNPSVSGMDLLNALLGQSQNIGENVYATPPSHSRSMYDTPGTSTRYPMEYRNGYSQEQRAYVGHSSQMLNTPFREPYPQHGYDRLDWSHPPPAAPFPTHHHPFTPNEPPMRREDGYSHNVNYYPQ